MWYQSRGYAPMAAVDGRLLADEDRDFYRVRRGVPSRAHNDSTEKLVWPGPSRQPVPGVVPPKSLSGDSSEECYWSRSWTDQRRTDRHWQDPRSPSLQTSHTSNPYSRERFRPIETPFHFTRPPDRDPRQRVLRSDHYGYESINFDVLISDRITYESHCCYSRNSDSPRSARNCKCHAPLHHDGVVPQHSHRRVHRDSGNHGQTHNYNIAPRYSDVRISPYDDFSIRIFTGCHHVDGILEWIEEVDEFFDYVEVELGNQVKIVARNFRDYAACWWKSLQHPLQD